MKTRINPQRFLKVLDELHKGAPILCVQSNQGAPKVWTADHPPLGVPFAYWHAFEALPTTEALGEAIDHLADRSSAARTRARIAEATLAKRVPGGYVDRRAGVEGGAQ
ncbi:hypothetical protein [Ruixingdingia sedimenti]|uniref:Uncharacterized protein n=1 Tax=Ruixingdingia sedimenti TaxID=3073604 RepID=A0ABU1FEK6_9RHOB|nr:hypothetical protein [Xinfangfangia sp. LG-4]MDR5655297.1 hypothetical protein [Xinfangfangia sp. LG-4]